MIKALLVVVLITCPGISALYAPTQVRRVPTQLSAGFGKTTKTSKAVQVKAGPKPMDKQWDNYFKLSEDGGVTKEVWITTPGGERPLPLGFVACKSDGDVAQALALQRTLVLWCAEGLHPRLAPFLRGKVKGEVTLELGYCDVAAVTEEEKAKELEVGEPVVDGKPPGGPLTMLGSTKAPPSLTPKDVGFMPFKSPITANQASNTAPKREMSSGRGRN